MMPCEHDLLFEGTCQRCGALVAAAKRQKAEPSVVDHLVGTFAEKLGDGFVRSLFSGLGEHVGSCEDCRQRVADVVRHWSGAR